MTNEQLCAYLLTLRLTLKQHIESIDRSLHTLQIDPQTRINILDGANEFVKSLEFQIRMLQGIDR